MNLNAEAQRLDHVVFDLLSREFWGRINHWIDWQTVMADVSLVGGFGHDMQPEYVDGEWIIIDEGSVGIACGYR